MKTHELKIWPKWFDAVKNGTKTFEIRRDDRGVEVGDQIIFEEFRPGVGEYTGRTTERRVSYISRGDDAEAAGLKEGHCVIGLERP